MDPHEEQEQELDVLSSIYPDELTKYSDKHFDLKIALDTPSDRKHFLILDVTYPENYPEVIPELRIEVTEANSKVRNKLNDNDDDDDVPVLATLSETIEFSRGDVDELLSKLREEAEVQVGMPVIFALATQLKDEGEALFQSKFEKSQKQYENELMMREREEQKKFHGTPVTKESWERWRTSFRKEMKLDEFEKHRRQLLHRGKLTGKEIFERGLAGNEDENENIEISNLQKLII